MWLQRQNPPSSHTPVPLGLETRRLCSPELASWTLLVLPRRLGATGKGRRKGKPCPPGVAHGQADAAAAMAAGSSALRRQDRGSGFRRGGRGRPAWASGSCLPTTGQHCSPAAPAALPSLGSHPVLEPAVVTPTRVNTGINRGRRSSPPVACGLSAEGPWSWAELTSPGWDDGQLEEEPASYPHQPLSSQTWKKSRKFLPLAAFQTSHRSPLSQGAAHSAGSAAAEWAGGQPAAGPGRARPASQWAPVRCSD